MADFSALKQSIETYIKNNGNKEITGAILQNILLSMVTTMGDGAINDNASDISDIKGDIQNINGDITNINGDITNINGDITNINGDITNINGDITDLNGDLSDEINRAERAEGTLQQNITAEENRAKGAETTTILFSDGKLVFKNAAGTVLYQLSVDSFLSAITMRLNTGALYAGYATPSTTPAALTSQEVFYLATQAGTYTNFHFNGGDDPIVLTKDGIYFIVSGTDDDDWNAEPMLQLDDVPTASSNNAVKSGGVAEELALGAVYDVSAKNPTAGPNSDGKWESLSALLSDANLNTLIPTSVRKGGMSIKFVSSVDNKYVQYRLMSNSFNTTVANWQGVDSVIDSAGSKNLAQSGAVELRVRSSVSGQDSNNANFNYCVEEIYTASTDFIENVKTVVFGNNAIFFYDADNHNLGAFSVNANEPKNIYSFVYNGIVVYVYVVRYRAFGTESVTLSSNVNVLRKHPNILSYINNTVFINEIRDTDNDYVNNRIFEIYDPNGTLDSTTTVAIMDSGNNKNLFFYNGGTALLARTISDFSNPIYKFGEIYLYIKDWSALNDSCHIIANNTHCLEKHPNIYTYVVREENHSNKLSISGVDTNNEDVNSFIREIYSPNGFADNITKIVTSTSNDGSKQLYFYNGSTLKQSFTFPNSNTGILEGVYELNIGSLYIYIKGWVNGLNTSITIDTTHVAILDRHPNIMSYINRYCSSIGKFTENTIVNRIIREIYTESKEFKEKVNLIYFNPNSGNSKKYIFFYSGSTSLGAMIVDSNANGIYTLNYKDDTVYAYINWEDTFVKSTGSYSATFNDNIFSIINSPKIGAYIANILPYSTLKGKSIAWYGTSIPEGGYPQIVGNALGCNLTKNYAKGSSSAANRGNFSYTEADRCLGHTIEEKVQFVNDLWTIDDANSTFTNGPRTIIHSSDIPNYTTYAQVIAARRSIITASYEVRLVAKTLISDDTERANYLKARLGTTLYNTMIAEDSTVFEYNDIDVWVWDHGHNDICTTPPDELDMDSYDIHNFVGAMNTYISLIYKYKNHPCIIIVSDYDNYQSNQYTIETQEAIAKRWHLTFIELYKHLPFNANVQVATNGYWETISGGKGVWHDSGLIWSDNGSSYTGNGYINDRIKQGKTFQQVKEYLNPRQDSDGKWWIDMTPRDIYIYDGLHPHTVANEKCINYYANVLKQLFEGVSLAGY